MAPNYNTYEEKIKRAKGRTFTMEEARQFERDMLTSPTGTTSSYQWVGAKTKRPIAFSY
jgi:Tfp pilus assembly protein PilE